MDALEAFQILKMKCLKAPVLTFTDSNKPFRLETDASGDGLGAVLSQIQDDGKYHPVAYASWSLKPSEEKYHSSKLEFLALKWAVMDQFRKYLQYKPFHIKTDNYPLRYVMSLPNLDATGHQWVAALASFNMSLEYIRGLDNKVADCLSRLTERLDKDSVRELMEKAKAGGQSIRAETNDPWIVHEEERLNHGVLLQMKALVARKTQFKNVANKHWIKSQKDDPVLQHVCQWVSRPKEDQRTLSEFLKGNIADVDRLAYSQRQQDLMMKRDLLYMATHTPGTKDHILTFVVPKKKCQLALDGCHQEVGTPRKGPYPQPTEGKVLVARHGGRGPAPGEELWAVSTI